MSVSAVALCPMNRFKKYIVYRDLYMMLTITSIQMILAGWAMEM